MQTFRDKPALAVGLLIVALVVVFLSWFLFMRTPEPKVEPVTPHRLPNRTRTKGKDNYSN